MRLLEMVHVFAVVIWVGGMFFAHQVLRPVAAEQLPPPQRLRLWTGVFKRFFMWVWLCVLVILLTGLGMIGLLGGMKALPWYIHGMLTAGTVMMAIYAYVYLVLYAGLKGAVAGEDWKAGGEYLARIRKMVGINLLLGVLTIGIAVSGPFWA